MRVRRWLGGVGLAAVALAGGFAWFLGATLAGPMAPERRTDALVVLTGGQDRVETGLALLEAGMAPRLLVSGVAPRLTVAELARAHGREAGALAARVTLGQVATTTVGNAAETAGWVRGLAEAGTPVRSIRVVTAAYHMPRAMLELGRALPGVELLAHPVRPAALSRGEVGNARAARLWGGEFVKYCLALPGLAALAPARGEAGAWSRGETRAWSRGETRA